MSRGDIGGADAVFQFVGSRVLGQVGGRRPAQKIPMFHAPILPPMPRCCPAGAASVSGPLPGGRRCRAGCRCRVAVGAIQRHILTYARPDRDKPDAEPCVAEDMSVAEAILDRMTDSCMPESSQLAGVATAAELAASGISRGQLQRLVRRGALLRLARGGYASAALVAAQSGDGATEHAVLAAAALMVAGTGTVVSHHSAALIHGLDMLGRGTERIVALTRLPASTSRRSGPPGVRLHVAALPAGHVVTCHGMPVTSVARTVIDLARTSSFPAGVVAADSALRINKTAKAELQSVIAACPRWPGLQVARQVAAFCDGRSESVLESVSRVAFRGQGLPAPELQVWVGDETEVIGRADFLWRTQRTIAEADGAIKYADPSRAMAQLERDARLREAGFEVVHFTWQGITQAPGQVAASIQAAFQRATVLSAARRRPAGR